MEIEFNCSVSASEPGETVELFRGMGVDAIGLFSPDVGAELKNFLREAVAREMPIGSLSPPWGWIDRALRDLSEVERLKAFIRVAGEAGVGKTLLSCSFVTPASEDERETHRNQVVEIYRAITKTAEAAGVSLCTHTSLRPGIMFGDPQGIDAFLEEIPSERNQLILCCGCAGVAGYDVPALIRHWQDKIGAVHIWNARGNWDKHVETRFDSGELDIFEALKALREIEYTGAVIPEHYPPFSGACGRDMSHGWAVGYLVAMFQALGVR
jgi:sugar phosphate isomerase/epimerase